MVKLDPVGEGREEIGRIVGEWSGHLLGGGPTCLGSCIGRRLNTICLKLKVLGLGW